MKQIQAAINFPLSQGKMLTSDTQGKNRFLGECNVHAEIRKDPRSDEICFEAEFTSVKNPKNSVTVMINRSEAHRPFTTHFFTHRNDGFFTKFCSIFCKDFFTKFKPEDREEIEQDAEELLQDMLHPKSYEMPTGGE